MGFQILIQMKGYVLNISIGHETSFFEQLPLICICKEYIEYMEVVWADCIWMSSYKSLFSK